MRIEVKKIAKGLNRNDSTGHGGAHGYTVCQITG